MSTQSNVHWLACLMLEAEPQPDGMTTSRYERLPGLYNTSDEAMAVAELAARACPEAIGYSAVRVGERHGH